MGFPLAITSKKTGKPFKPKPVNNTRADKLTFMWRYSFQDRRCLIPMTGFAEAEGEKGAKTRTWFSLPEEPVFAGAGIWRDTDEWGPAYSMVMTEACIHIADVHDRMPVILRREDWSDWLGGPADAAGLSAAERTPRSLGDLGYCRWSGLQPWQLPNGGQDSQCNFKASAEAEGKDPFPNVGF